MKKMLGIFLRVLLAGAVVGCHDTRFESSYPTLRDAVKDHADERLWIPTFLPESSRNIHLVGELSPSTEWCAFEFSPGDSQRLRQALKPVEILPESMKYIPRLRKPWWPSFLEGNVDPARVEKANFHLYITASISDPELFAVNVTEGRGYFYSPTR